MKHRHAKRARNSAVLSPFFRVAEALHRKVDTGTQRGKRFDPPNFMYLAILWAVSPIFENQGHYRRCNGRLDETSGPKPSEERYPVRINPVCSDPSRKKSLLRLRHEQDMRLLNYTHQLKFQIIPSKKTVMKRAMLSITHHGSVPASMAKSPSVQRATTARLAVARFLRNDLWWAYQ